MNARQSAENDATAETLCRDMHPTRWEVKTALGACFDCQRAVSILRRTRVIPPAKTGGDR